MFEAERFIISHGSETEMRNIFVLAERENRRGAWAAFGYVVAAMRGNIAPFSEGNYRLSEKGAILQLVEKVGQRRE